MRRPPARNLLTPSGAAAPIRRAAALADRVSYGSPRVGAAKVAMKQCSKCGLKYPSDTELCFVDQSALVEIQDPRVGSTIAGRYLVEGVIGAGGMATVYRAKERLGGRACAIKVMNTSFAGNNVIRERFRREAKAAQRLAHPNIIEIFDQGDTDDGTLYLVMELLDGVALADVVEKGKVPLERALPIWIQVARALARAHDFEVIHRDLKPENIFLARRGNVEWVKLLDFGIARSMHDKRLTGAGEVFGTPQYMAPERITSIDSGPAADLYSVGVIMFEMLTGELPFDAQDVGAFFLKHLKEQPRAVRELDPSVPEPLDRLVAQLLAKDPKARPVDAHRLHADLVGLAGLIGVRLPKDSLAATPARPVTGFRPAGVEHWKKRSELFARMVSRVYGPVPPPEQATLLAQIRGKVTELDEVRTNGAAEQRALDVLEARGRDGRERFGHAMDALGVDASRARDEAKTAEQTTRASAPEVDQARARFEAAHGDLLRWEGRVAFREPYAELAAAYRAAAASVDAWVTVKARQEQLTAALGARRADVADLEFQIQALRGSLAQHEEQTEQERERCQASVQASGRRAVELEAELLEVSARLCAPLRARPELRGMFDELEAAAAA